MVSSHEYHPADEDASGLLWVEGANYVSGWVDARDAAAKFNAAVAVTGDFAEELSASPRTAAEGKGEVRVTGSPAAVEWMAECLLRTTAE